MSLGQILITSLLMPILNIILWMIIIGVIMSWLVSFNVINLRNQMARQVYNVVERFNHAILDPIRRVIPPLGGLDFSPIVAILGIQLIQSLLMNKLFVLVG